MELGLSSLLGSSRPYYLLLPGIRTLWRSQQLLPPPAVGMTEAKQSWNFHSPNRNDTAPTAVPVIIWEARTPALPSRKKLKPHLGSQWKPSRDLEFLLTVSNNTFSCHNRPEKARMVRSRVSQCSFKIYISQLKITCYSWVRKMPALMFWRVFYF